MVFYFADLEQQITRLGIKAVVYGSLILITATVVAAVMKNKSPKLKLPLFLVMALTLLGVTGLLFGGTVYLNTRSESGGPVHWHADIEFWACGTEVELRDPHGLLSNKIGTATFHEHNDKRIHLEGVVVRKAEDASLSKFMRVTGGYVTPDAIGIPLNESSKDWYVSGDQVDGDPVGTAAVDDLSGRTLDGKDGPVLNLKNGLTCGDEHAELQVFVYRYDKESKTYSQTKIANPPTYTLRDESQVPPGDCVIVEFDAPKERTDKLCRQYGVRDSQRCVEFGVKAYTPDLCNIREVEANASSGKEN